MKKIQLLFTILLLMTMTAFSQENPIYNKKLADSLGSDDYGMKMYTMVLLKTGPTKIENKSTVDSLFAGHMSNMGKMVSANQLVVAGPFGKNDKSYRGIFILNVKTTEEAKALLATDPAVKAGLLEADIIPWYGSAALPLYLKGHDIIQKKKM